ncbi:SusD/RagB family nutrient-binding outer membrane lipoprotein [Arenibacter latericius]|uniref:SusD/RagB family nutrient-binding outer membrane lipoprotein n=1 Tax=Arenibacter latericius TaxID=86104 RepID=UPI00041E172A|nr:SusD/RagB family nutrient-binding outer membrane lipoprotein [Arenibacter latericius]
MKNIQTTIIKTAVVIVIGLSFFSCEKHLDDLRDNPNAVTQIDDAALFTKAVRSLFQGTTDQSVSRFAGQYAHYFVAGSTARPPDQYGDGFDENYNDMFTGMYGGTIRHIEEVLEITSAAETENEVRYAMAQVIAVLGYARLTDAFGDIPYTEGGKGKTEGILQPKYDTQEFIYQDMIKRLGASVNVLKDADPALGYPNSDPIFNNDLEKWTRFANSVRLRLAMRLRDADNSLSLQTVNECLANPLMEDNSHNATMIETEGNGNAWFGNRTGYPSIKMSTKLIDQLQGTDDPRLAVYVSKDQQGNYSGMINGLGDVAFGNSNFSAKSDMGIALSSRDSELYLMNAAEVWLLRAEAALVYDNDPVTANTLYRKGIETSLMQWDIENTDITTFLSSPTATLSGSNDEEQIGVQMWLALTPNFYESWSYIRRTGFPVIEERTDPKSSRGVTNGIMPKRFLYSSFELSSNNNNVTQAIERQGGNKISVPVWWDKN